MNGRAAVYRLYDSSGDLLYVGVTASISNRWEQHAKKQSWWPEVTHQTVAWFDDRPEAEKSETAAIETEDPTHNIRGVKGRVVDAATGFPRRRTGDNMQEKSSDEARRDFRRVLSDAEDGKPTVITRYGEPVAVVVPADWYEMAVAILERDEGKR